MRISTILLVALLPLVMSCSETDKIVELGVADGCDAAVAYCGLGNGEIYLRLGMEGEIRPLQQFRTELHIQSADSVTEAPLVEFQMLGMEMGLNRYQFVRDGGVWRVDALLPICVAGRSDWIARVELSAAGRQYRAGFHFSLETD